MEDGWTKCNHDTGAAKTAFPEDLSVETLGKSSVMYKTARGELVPGYGAGHLEGTDENGKTKKLAGEYNDGHKS